MDKAVDVCDGALTPAVPNGSQCPNSTAPASASCEAQALESFPIGLTVAGVSLPRRTTRTRPVPCGFSMKHV